ncbi:MAG: putative sporulation protein YtxC [Clostridia bacterium]|nr:putative sporulation protein YtxC [Clostridia bacterium]
MSSLCIKTNNDDILTYLQNEFSEFNMLNVYYSRREFKSYKNIIIHYTGIDNELFYTKLATILSYLVIDYFETDITKNILQSNYFYFDYSEFTKILALCTENLCDSEFSFTNRQMLLFDAFYEYIKSHHSIVLSGFINFRLHKYKKLLEDLVDLSVNEFIIEREYLEFVSLLRIYINSQNSSKHTVHLVSLDTDTFLLDENMNFIDIDTKALNAKYLSDVSFSNNDYVLNTLLNLLPQKIYLHKISPLSNLDFINTLQLIFENRIESCNDCNICNLYKKIKTGIKK